MKPSMPWKLIFIVVLLLSLALAGCGRISRQADQAPEVNVTLAVDPDPPRIGPASLTVSVAGRDGAPIDGARLQVKGDMTHAGMTPVLAEVKDGQMGRYQVPFEWTMGGDWVVTITAGLPDGRTTVRQFSYTVEGDVCGTQPSEQGEAR